MTDQEKIELYKINRKLEILYRTVDTDYSNPTMRYDLWNLTKRKRELEK